MDLSSPQRLELSTPDKLRVKATMGVPMHFVMTPEEMRELAKMAEQNLAINKNVQMVEQIMLAEAKDKIEAEQQVAIKALNSVTDSALASAVQIELIRTEALHRIYYEMRLWESRAQNLVPFVFVSICLVLAMEWIRL